MKALLIKNKTIINFIGNDIKIVLKWLVSIEVFFQFIRMIYHWNTPGVYAGWTFLLHFAVLTALTYFVSIYKPKGL